ncbi:hypothetical protein [Butyrivibrio sp. AE3003]|uniref:hypothetical protein n=1 Tax=Butyrivibrio sp. AE3003 TaxID=1496721 RepID=UPI00047C1662|nr:hypothetical protein [Butyrivibrio sp. AE3003]
MANRLPRISFKHKVCIICEGNEEYKYLERLRELHVWNDIYDISLVNAEGNGNIPARYQDRYQNGSYEAVLVFCDTEKKPYEQYEDIKRKINEFHGIDNAAEEIVIFANPCTMQIVSKHWTDETIKSPAKKVNAPLIERFTGVKDYKGKAAQIDELMKYVTDANYDTMRNNICKATRDEKLVGSTNFNKLISYLDSCDSTWITTLNQVLE